MVWIGTEDGLNLLDGSAIRIFKHRDHDSSSISNNIVNAIKEDAEGNIWIATSSGLNCYGLWSFDTRDNSFKKQISISFKIPVDNDVTLVSRKFDVKTLSPKESQAIVYGYYTIKIEYRKK